MKQDFTVFLHNIEAGIPKTRARVGSGYSYYQIDALLKKGQMDVEAGKETKEGNSYLAYEAAVQTFTGSMINSIKKSNDWKAFAWMLEKNDPKNYGNEQKIEQAPISITLDIKDSKSQDKRILDMEEKIKNDIS